MEGWGMWWLVLFIFITSVVIPLALWLTQVGGKWLLLFFLLVDFVSVSIFGARFCDEQRWKRFLFPISTMSFLLTVCMIYAIFNQKNVYLFATMIYLMSNLFSLMCLWNLFAIYKHGHGISLKIYGWMIF
jgi:uncharacterized membrane protein